MRAAATPRWHENLESRTVLMEEQMEGIIEELARLSVATRLAAPFSEEQTAAPP